MNLLSENSELNNIKQAAVSKYGHIRRSKYLWGKSVFDVKNKVSQLLGPCRIDIANRVYEDIPHSSIPLSNSYVHLDQLINACNNAQELNDVLWLIDSVFRVSTKGLREELRQQTHQDNTRHIVSVLDILSDITKTLATSTEQLGAIQDNIDTLRQQLTVAQ